MFNAPYCAMAVEDGGNISDSSSNHAPVAVSCSSSDELELDADCMNVSDSEEEEHGHAIHLEPDVEIQDTIASAVNSKDRDRVSRFTPEDFFDMAIIGVPLVIIELCMLVCRSIEV